MNKKTKDIFVIYPTQLYENIDLIKKYNVFLVEDETYFTKYKFHKLKIAYHRATMKKYQDYLLSKKINVSYFNFNENYFIHLEKNNVYIYDPIDHDVIEKNILMSKKYKYKLSVLESKNFVTTYESLKDYNKNVFKNKFSHNSSFYRWQRKNLDIMYPIGEKYKLSYDDENKEKFEKSQKDVFNPKNINNSYVKEAIKYTNKYFNNNLGSLDNFIYPIDHVGAKKWLNDFIKNRLKKFGTYEDAFDDKIKFGFHSVLSPLLNIGLITDEDVLEKILPLKSKIPMNSYEGYIRQLIGWKQGVRYLYQFHYDKFKNKNFLKSKNKISYKFWTAETGIPPVDDCIKKALKYSYLHHIERLMIMGNFFLITMVNPNEVFNWFITFVSIDAYQWVMYPNVYGMITYADEGFMMSRPYMSSSSYIKKMSGYSKNKQKVKLGNEEYQWDEIWDALYYNFINKHYDILKKNYFIARNTKHWDNKTTDEKTKLLSLAKKYLKFLND